MSAENQQNKQQQKGDSRPKIDKVRDWLNSAGYPLEMRVARAFKRGSFDGVVQGDIYRSGEKYREIDVSAVIGEIHDIDPRDEDSDAIWFELLVVCECKRNPAGNRPWVVFTDHTEDDDAPFMKVLAHRANDLGALLLKEAIEREEVVALDLFAAPTVGYAARCASLDQKPRENNQDPAYEAVTAVMDAAVARARVPSLHKSYARARVVIPLIVTDADLFECWLNADGELKLAPRKEMALVQKHPGPRGAPSTMVHIVTEAKLADWVARVEVAAEALFLPDELEDGLERLRKAAKASAARARKSMSKARNKPKTKKSR